MDDISSVDLNDVIASYGDFSVFTKLLGYDFTQSEFDLIKPAYVITEVTTKLPELMLLFSLWLCMDNNITIFMLKNDKTISATWNSFITDIIDNHPALSSIYKYKQKTKFNLGFTNNSKIKFFAINSMVKDVMMMNDIKFNHAFIDDKDYNKCPDSYRDTLIQNKDKNTTTDYLFVTKKRKIQ